MKITTLILTFATLSLSVVQAAEPFEGKVTMKMTDPKGDAHEMSYSIKGPRVVISMGVGERVMSIIMDRERNEYTTLMPQQRLYMVRSMPQAPAGDQSGAPGDVSLQNTGVTDKILGYTCTKYALKSRDSTTELWLTDQLGSYAAFGTASRGGPPQLWEEALKGKNFFPLRIVAINSAGSETFRLEVTAVEKQSLDDSLFTPPADWRKIDMGAMMRGMVPPQ